MSGEFRSARPDRDFTTKPVIEQATKPIKPQHNSLYRRLRNLTLASVITAGAIGAGAVAFNEYDKRAQTELTFGEMLAKGDIAGIDTSTYQISTYVDGSFLHIRKSSSNKGEEIDIDKIRKINGVEWKGNTPFIVKNSPYKMDLDPMNGIGQDAWLAVELDVETLMGNNLRTIGFINNGVSTERHISVIDKGKIAHPSKDSDGQLVGMFDSGRVIPAERIALGIPPSQEASPQS